MKIGRSSISVNVATPYTRVGHCDNARWMSVSVLVTLVGNELAQSFKRIIESLHSGQTCGRSGAKSSCSSVSGGIKANDLPNNKVAVF